MKTILFENLLLQTYYKELNRLFLILDKESYPQARLLTFVYQPVSKRS